jgi:hypothetical protein
MHHLGPVLVPWIADAWDVDRHQRCVVHGGRG